MAKRKSKRGKRRRRVLLVLLVILLLGVAAMWGLWRLAYRPRVPMTAVEVPTAVPTPIAERIEPSDRQLLEAILRANKATPTP